VIYREILKKYSSRELLLQMGQNSAWSIPRTGIFKLVQIRSLGSQIAPPQGLELLHSERKGKYLKDLFKNCCTKWDNI